METRLEKIQRKFILNKKLNNRFDIDEVLYHSQIDVSLLVKKQISTISSVQFLDYAKGELKIIRIVEVGSFLESILPQTKSALWGLYDYLISMESRESKVS